MSARGQRPTGREPGLRAYTAAKAGIQKLTESLDDELKMASVLTRFCPAPLIRRRTGWSWYSGTTSHRQGSAVHGYRFNRGEK